MPPKSNETKGICFSMLAYSLSPWQIVIWQAGRLLANCLLAGGSPDWHFWMTRKSRMVWPPVALSTENPRSCYGLLTVPETAGMCACPTCISRGIPTTCIEEVTHTDHASLGYSLWKDFRSAYWAREFLEDLSRSNRKFYFCWECPTMGCHFPLMQISWNIYEANCFAFV